MVLERGMAELYLFALIMTVVNEHLLKFIVLFFRSVINIMS